MVRGERVGINDATQVGSGGSCSLRGQGKRLKKSVNLGCLFLGFVGFSRERLGVCWESVIVGFLLLGFAAGGGCGRSRLSWLGFQLKPGFCAAWRRGDGDESHRAGYGRGSGEAAWLLWMAPNTVGDEEANYNCMGDCRGVSSKMSTLSMRCRTVTPSLDRFGYLAPGDSD